MRIHLTARVLMAASWVAPLSRGVLEDGGLEGDGASDLEANVVLLVSPVEADEGGEGGFLHVDSWSTVVVGTCRARAQRRQHGEPVKRLSLSVRYGQRHTRGRETELVSISYSSLQVRRPRLMLNGAAEWS
jgi:hypothetical protein